MRNDFYEEPIIVAVVGEKDSGKTMTVEYITHQLSIQGFTVTCIKHTHHSSISIDQKGRDTERFAAAGARTVVSVAREQLVIIRKADMSSLNLAAVMGLLKSFPSDFVIVEGFHSAVAKRRDVYKIIVAIDLKGAGRSLMGTAPPILAITGKIGNQMDGETLDNIPILRLEKSGSLLVRRITGVAPIKKQQYFQNCSWPIRMHRPFHRTSSDI